jgi:hypothetical protein
VRVSRPGGLLCCPPKVDECQFRGERRWRPGALLCLAGDARGVDAQRGLAGLVQQRSDFGSAGLIDREDDAAHVGLGPVKAAPPAGLGRRFCDLREGAGAGLLTDAYRQPPPLFVAEPRGTVAR